MGPVVEVRFPIIGTVCEALFKRWPKFELAVEPSQIQWRRQPGIRAITHLPVAA
jgi:hypothetical protein